MVIGLTLLLELFRPSPQDFLTGIMTFHFFIVQEIIEDLVFVDDELHSELDL